MALKTRGKEAVVTQCMPDPTSVKAVNRAVKDHCCSPFQDCSMGLGCCAISECLYLAPIVDNRGPLLDESQACRCVRRCAATSTWTGSTQAESFWTAVLRLDEVQAHQSGENLPNLLRPRPWGSNMDLSESHRWKIRLQQNKGLITG